MKIYIVRLKSDRLVVVCNRLLVMPELHLRKGSFVVGNGILRMGFYHLVQQGNRSLVAALGGQIEGLFN